VFSLKKKGKKNHLNSKQLECVKMDGNGIGESFLKKKKKKYYEDCPGCKTSLFKETNIGVPYKHLLYVWIVFLCAGSLKISTNQMLFLRNWNFPLISVFCGFDFCSFAYIISLSFPLFHGEHVILESFIYIIT
jgi:hypothetical protein